MDHVLKKVMLVELMISTWSGAARLTRDDLGAGAASPEPEANGIQLPPSEIASVGSIKLIDSAETSVFTTLKKRAERAIRNIGTSFLRGYAVAVDQMPSLTLELDGLKAEFEQAATTLLNEYQQKVNQFVAAYPHWEPVIRRKCPTDAYLREQIRFDWLAVKVMLDDTTTVVLRDKLEAEVGGLGQQLLKEIATEAYDFEASCITGRTKPMTARTLGPLKAMLTKLESLSFLDGNAVLLAQQVRDRLAVMPRNGALDPQQAAEIVSLVELLKHPTRVIQAHAAMRNIVQPALDLSAPADEMPPPALQPIPVPSPATFTWF